MKSVLLISTLILSWSHLVDSETGIPGWHPPTPDDVRGPCPMLNTLSNHGYLPHNGRDITREVLRQALARALNFDSALTDVMFDQAIFVNPEPGATAFTLDHLNRHNILEHDASLSRVDAYFGNNHVFNQTVFDETRKYWVEPLLTAKMLAVSKLARQVTSKAFNPTYTFTSSTENFSEGEVGAPIIAFGDIENMTVDRAFVEYFFVNERLPIELGWEKRSGFVELKDVLKVTAAIRSASQLVTESRVAQESLDEYQDVHIVLDSRISYQGKE
ncbi:Chloroperoxidase [Dactylonectria macrodidyma]|uniref:Chloroperoxidase n=1 Tax=Dactylonectria macrodidyma TaxID=307937 RepID=A0A9P9DV38_9HYPO|nr:Chloroperoxidase [Dactylonectria macrodidyma]